MLLSKMKANKKGACISAVLSLRVIASGCEGSLCSKLLIVVIIGPSVFFSFVVGKLWRLAYFLISFLCISEPGW